MKRIRTCITIACEYSAEVELKVMDDQTIEEAAEAYLDSDHSEDFAATATEGYLVSAEEVE